MQGHGLWCSSFRRVHEDRRAVLVEHPTTLNLQTGHGHHDPDRIGIADLEPAIPGDDTVGIHDRLESPGADQVQALGDVEVPHRVVIGTTRRRHQAERVGARGQNDRVGTGAGVGLLDRCAQRALARSRGADSVPRQRVDSIGGAVDQEAIAPVAVRRQGGRCGPPQRTGQDQRRNSPPEHPRLASLRGQGSSRSGARPLESRGSATASDPMLWCPFHGLTHRLWGL